MSPITQRAARKHRDVPSNSASLACHGRQARAATESVLSVEQTLTRPSERTHLAERAILANGAYDSRGIDGIGFVCRQRRRLNQFMEIGMMRPSADCAPGPPTDISRLRKHLEHLVAVSEGVFSSRFSSMRRATMHSWRSVSLERLGCCRGLVLENAADVALGPG
jgi:hypothetical protein